MEDTSTKESSMEDFSIEDSSMEDSSMEDSSMDETSMEDSSMENFQYFCRQPVFVSSSPEKRLSIFPFEKFDFH